MKKTLVCARLLSLAEATLKERILNEEEILSAFYGGI